jgi:hypothetical protein
MVHVVTRSYLINTLAVIRLLCVVLANTEPGLSFIQRSNNKLAVRVNSVFQAGAEPHPLRAK